MAGSAYGKGREYWDKRYKKDEEQFDWYQRYDTLKHILEEVTPKSMDRILMVGCGNSRMSEHMVEDGYAATSITNVDISPVVIDQMRKKHPEMDWRVADATRMPEFGDRTFDAAIDKGTMDAILCGEGSAENTEKILSEMARIIKPGGVFLLITYGQPKTRLHYLCKEKFGWDVEQRTVAKQAPPGSDEKADVHYIYICRKKK
ncbi:catalytic, putative [Acanthamoeba castellanii str. Neff]|jgi:ubiquinone/menaquinone biosynthesis C-methylase UbiE|uniref:Catalytic, putative n=1 Tax=Acanthamoeba castellanii (strain ATCC 30010 / Neff) TaxID=1257118 RepID=L8GQP4_ACACF|nr:catalytic, putative [Acanthamoeba castellanii str. Neff]ELR15315.1 catalytic, putative [Acanthamoeba castellanii str. Neff]